MFNKSYTRIRASGNTKKKKRTHILNLGIDLDVGIDAGDEVLDCTSHALITGRTLAPLPAIVRGQDGGVIWWPGNLGGCS